MENTNEQTADDIRSVTSIIFLDIILVVFIIFSVCGNILVVVTIIKTPHLCENKSNFLIINLAITDMLNGCTVILSTIVATAIDTHTMPFTLCNIMSVATYLFITSSMLTLCFISIERLFAVVYPLTYIQHIGNKVLGLAIAWSWIQGLVFAIVPCVENWVRYDYWEIRCALQWHKIGDGAKQFAIVLFSVCFLIPSLILAFNYFKILHEARKKIRIWPITQNGQKTVKKQLARSRTVISLLIVVCAYFICMTPFCVIRIIKASMKRWVIPGYISTMASLLTFCSSVLNPLIYGILRRDFRNAFKNIIRKKKSVLFVNRSLQATSGIEFSHTM